MAQLDRFKNEIRILSQLDHPNIVRFVEAGESEIPVGASSRQLPWLAMEYVSGASLRAKLKQKPKSEWKDIHILLENVLQALDHIHSKNLCHRDIKPDNLIFDPNAATWKLVDFGIAKEMVDNLRLTMTMVESNPGAWDYMSPEQSRGKHLDIRSDIYSLGLTAWEALIGEVPRPGAAFPSAMLGADSVPPDVDKLIAKMTAHHVEDRYQSPAEALAALHEGAGVIEKKETGRKQRSKLLRRLAIASAAAATATIVWFAGNQFATQRAKDIVDSVPQSDTRYTRIHQKLSIFRNNHAFWGRRYADQQYAAAEQRAVVESQKMKEIFADIKIALADAGKTDEYKFNRCEAFCKTYDDVFGDASEVKELFIQRAILDARIIATKADSLAAKGQTKEAVELCDQARTRISLPEAATIIAETRARIADGYAKDKLTEVATLLSAKGEQDITKAQNTVLQVEKIVGPTPATQSALKKADDLLWSMISDEASTALSRDDLDAACRALDRYAEVSELKMHKTEAMTAKNTALQKADDALYSAAVKSANAYLKEKEYARAAAVFDKYLESASLKTHREDAAKAKDKIREFEDNNDWAIVSASAEQNLSQHTFKQASDDYENYLKKWASGLHAAEARQALDQVVGKHFQFLGEIKNYDDFNDEFNEVCEMYPSEHARLQTARKWLVYQCHNEIWRLYRETAKKNLLQTTALEKVGQIKYSKAEPEKRKYLDDLTEALKAYLQTPSVYTANYFLFLWQRPPGDCVNMSEQPTVYYITVESLDVSLSDSVYSKIKGIGDADPRIRVNLCRDKSGDNYPVLNEVFNGLGAVNQRSFSVTINKGALFEKGSEVLLFVLDDADVTGDNNIKSGRLDNASLGSNQTATWNLDGTTFTLHYTMQ